MSIEPGTVFGNRYTLVSRIAVGGMGEVWRASDRVLGRTVAIKLLSANLAQQEGFAERFREEARHTALLGHPNIATVYDYGEDDGASWLVMEFVEGEPLSQIIREQGAQSPRRTAMIIGQCAEALQAAHEAGVIHRDVKPANILLRPDGVAKLTDFGIARAKDAAPMTRTGEVMGTAQYISPEQAMGKTVSGSSDIYSLGCVAYELLTGERLFDEGSAVATAMAHVHNVPPPLPVSVPNALAAVIESCLAKDPAQRPESARAVAKAMKGGPAAAAAAVPQGFATRQMPEQSSTRQLTSPTAYATHPADRYGAGQGGRPSGPSRPVALPERKTNPWMVAGFGVLTLVAIFAVLRMTGLVGEGSKPTPKPSSGVSISAPPSTPSESSSSSSSSTPARPSNAPPPPPKPAASASIDLATYRGKDAQIVAGALTRRGFTQIVTEDVESELPPGTVVAISPSGLQPLDRKITLTVSMGMRDRERPSPSTNTPSTTPSSRN
ncbi:serine/threonine protein kinase [Austwickia chelonae]|uniref:non-specific serine/threonine protein kinase n=1 Tax=Austwickia chelonae NBRC 105200 TaxID=1184607 RepID=K6WB92_9MICO|nr:serine/threonine-protein kinase [Austwickia chelonae]GAB79092.1 putative serine/threonine protein kinase [Austwickia chelonae NBRC 105200]SEW42202.1 serine/threonine protein kinase [Austwickia chelonae]